MACADTLDQRLNLIEQSDLLASLAALQHGIEKEGLRVDGRGRIAQTPHPRALGSAMTNSRITTDYSEALLEFITPVFRDVDAALEYLQDLHNFTFEKLADENIWLASMPPQMQGADDIPIARYGSSNIGTMKHIYRVGLEHRYGKLMQTIAGIHYNFSLPDSFWEAYQGALDNSADPQDFRSSQYFALIRNFRRYSWLLIYLFGASPALSRSFMAGCEVDGLEALGEDTLYGPYATSLRMSDLGYSNDAQSSLNICYNHLNNYVRTLNDAISKPYPDYQKMGVKVDGQYRQLNANLLQIENEYYSDIRPKRVINSGEKPIRALQRGGVEYVEVRNLDINPFLPIGIDSEQANFIDVFLIYCLLKPSPEIDADECERIKRNHRAVVWQGRNPELQLEQDDGLISMRRWGEEVLSEMIPVANSLDKGQQRSCHSHAVSSKRELLTTPELTPSGKVVTALQKGLSHDAFVLQQSQRHQQRVMTQPLAASRRQELEEMAAASLREQQAIEAADELSFDEFLAQYQAQ